MQKAERLLGALGAVASIIAAVDYFFFGSRALSIPTSIPTGVFALVVFGLLAVYFAGIWWRRLKARKTGEADGRERKMELEDAAVNAELRQAAEREAWFERQLAELRSERERSETLKLKVIGVLARGEADVNQILPALAMPMNDSAVRQALMNALGTLAEEGKVAGAKTAFGYRLIARE